MDFISNLLKTDDRNEAATVLLGGHKPSDFDSDDDEVGASFEYEPIVTIVTTMVVLTSRLCAEV